MSEIALIEFARAWASRLPEKSIEIEQARCLPAEISRAFAEGGLFHALVPTDYGGAEIHPAAMVEIIKQISRGDGSAGWNVMIGATTGLLAASLPTSFAREIYGTSPGVLTVGVTAPLGKAERLADGYRVTGRWPFASGSQHADWICGGCLVFSEGVQVFDDKGHDKNHGKGDDKNHGKGDKPRTPEVHLMMFKRDQITIEDTWHVAGLKGTGSHHFHVEDQFVPMGRSVVLGGRARVERPLYQFPMLGLLALGVSSVSLGIGYRALDAFRTLAGGKTPTGSSRTLINRAEVQSQVARSVADLESAEAWMLAEIHRAYALASQGERLPTATRARLRLAAANATHSAVRAVDRLYQAGGGSAIYEDNDLQRCFRDVHVTTQHIMVATPIYEVVGRVELGLDPRSAL